MANTNGQANNAKVTAIQSEAQIIRISQRPVQR